MKFPTNQNHHHDAGRNEESKRIEKPPDRGEREKVCAHTRIVVLRRKVEGASDTVRIVPESTVNIRHLAGLPIMRLTVCQWMQ